jgi:hypothetical protein
MYAPGHPMSLSYALLGNLIGVRGVRDRRFAR